MTMKQISLKEYIESFLCMTQDEAALSIGITRGYLNRVMNGKVAAGRPLCVKLSRWGKGKIDLAPLMMIEKGK